MTVLAIEWFENNQMKLNQEKCYLLVPGHKQGNVWARIGQTKSGRVWQKLLGVEIAWSLKLKNMFHNFARKLQKNCLC